MTTSVVARCFKMLEEQQFTALQHDCFQFSCLGFEPKHYLYRKIDNIVLRKVIHFQKAWPPLCHDLIYSHSSDGTENSILLVIYSIKALKEK